MESWIVIYHYARPSRRIYLPISLLHKQIIHIARNMPRVFAVHIADGFADDCEELVQRCVQTDTLNYQVFCNIWKEMNFALVYQGRVSGAEVAELTEGFLEIAKRHMVGNSINFEESVAGLFLVYALLHLQPYKGFAPLRVIPSDLEAINRLEETARKQRRHDVLYILGSLLIEGPVQWQLAEKEYGIERQITKNFDVTTSIDKVGVRPRGVFHRHTEELDLIRELSALTRRYTTAKAAVTGSSRPQRTLSYVDDRLAGALASSLKVIINGIETDIPTAEQTRSEAIQKIKQRAMTDTVNQMKHLISADDVNCTGAVSSNRRGRKRKKRGRPRTAEKWKKAQEMETSDQQPSTSEDSTLQQSDSSNNSPQKRTSKNYAKTLQTVLAETPKKNKGKTTAKLKAKNKQVSPKKPAKIRVKKNKDSSSSESDLDDVFISGSEDDVLSCDDNVNLRDNDNSVSYDAQKSVEVVIDTAVPVSLEATCQDIEIEFINEGPLTEGDPQCSEIIIPDFIENDASTSNVGGNK